MTTSTHDELVSRLTLGPGVSVGTMFGMVTLKVGRKAFAGYAREGMVFKLAGDAHAQALSLAGAHLFDPMGGRPTKEWMVAPTAEAAARPQLAEEALEYCR